MINSIRDYSKVFVEDVVCNSEIYNDYTMCDGDSLRAMQIVNKQVHLFTDVNERTFSGVKDFMRTPTKLQARRLPIMRPSCRVQAVLLPLPLALLRRLCYVLAQKGDPTQ